MINYGSKQGGTLVIVMVVMMALAIVSLGLFKMAEQDAVESVRLKQSQQAFWIAESGIQKTVRKLHNDKNYRNSIDNAASAVSIADTEVEIDLGGSVGSYSGNVSSDGNGTYTIHIAGAVQDTTRGIKVVARELRPHTAALQILEGGGELDGIVKIIGDVEHWGGDALSLGDEIEVEGTLYSDNLRSDNYTAQAPTRTTTDFDVDTMYTYERNYAQSHGVEPPRDIPIDIDLNDYPVEIRNGERYRTAYFKGEDLNFRKITAPTDGSRGQVVSIERMFVTTPFFIGDNIDIISDHNIYMIDSEKNGSEGHDEIVRLNGLDPVAAEDERTFGTNVVVFAGNHFRIGIHGKVRNPNTKNVLIAGSVFNIKPDTTYFEWSGLIIDKEKIEIKEADHVIIRGALVCREGDVKITGCNLVELIGDNTLINSGFSQRFITTSHYESTRQWQEYMPGRAADD